MATKVRFAFDCASFLKVDNRMVSTADPMDHHAHSPTFWSRLLARMELLQHPNTEKKDLSTDWAGAGKEGKLKGERCSCPSLTQFRGCPWL